jgi:hypothetical protein
MLRENRSSSTGSTQEKTLAMIKPDGLFGNYTDRIKNAILESGFSIFKEMVVQLDEDSAASFYAEHSTKSFFSSLVKYMTRYLLCFYDCRILLLINEYFFPSLGKLHISCLHPVNKLLD